MVKMAWRRRRRRGKRGRFPKPVTIPNPPKANKLVPKPETNSKSILIEPAEAEALRLVDLEGLSQMEAGSKMGVSRGTIWRLLQSARRKVAKALIEGRALVVSNEINQTTR
jgi:predicted DNA-binding protein (UPF0251 family)